MIRMINPTRDGYADAYTETDAVYLEGKGWARYVAPKAQEAQEAREVEMGEVPNVPRKRGRPAKVD